MLCCVVLCCVVLCCVVLCCVVLCCVVLCCVVLCCVVLCCVVLCCVVLCCCGQGIVVVGGDHRRWHNASPRSECLGDGTPHLLPPSRAGTATQGSEGGEGRGMGRGARGGSAVRAQSAERRAQRGRAEGAVGQHVSARSRQSMATSEAVRVRDGPGLGDPHPRGVTPGPGPRPLDAKRRAEPGSHSSRSLADAYTLHKPLAGRRKRAVSQVGVSEPKMDHSSIADGP